MATLADIYRNAYGGDLDAIPVQPEDTSSWWDRMKAQWASGGWQDPQPGQRGTFVPGNVGDDGKVSAAVPGILQQPAEGLASLMTAPLSDIVRSGDRDAMRAAAEASFDVASMLPAAGVAAGRMRQRGATPERAPEPAPAPPREYSTGPEQIVPDYSYGRAPFQDDWPYRSFMGPARTELGQDLLMTDPIGIYQTEVGVPGAATVLKYQDMPARMKTVGQDPVPGVRGMDGKPVYSNPDDPTTAAILAAMTAQDNLGYYSGALEGAKRLRQSKGTPEQMLAMLKKEGAKDGEIEATGLRQFLDGKSSVTKDDIIQHLDGNRIGLNEVRYGGKNGVMGKDPSQIGTSHQSKWHDNSLDPQNPTYRETVLHLPEKPPSWDEYAARVREDGYEPSRADYDSGDWRSWKKPNFQSGHFDEPNIIGHMMTSMTKHEGKPVYTIDQIQSDWGQKIRDGGVRDEAKIAELKASVDAVQAAIDQQISAYVKRSQEYNTPKNIKDRIFGVKHKMSTDPKEALEIMRLNPNIYKEVNNAESELARLRAELRTAEASSPGHPLVNTTDQWTNTTLRRAIRQAAEADADYIAIPSGKTVLSYNPGDEAGMEGFYNQIVPKNLRNLARKLDKDVPDPMSVSQLETPIKGMAGDGFTLFHLTEALKRAAIDKGQPLFANGQDPTTAAILAILTQQQQGQLSDGADQGSNSYGISDILNSAFGISPAGAMDYKSDDRESRNVIDRSGQPVESQSIMDWLLYGNPNLRVPRNRALERWQSLPGEEKERLKKKDLEDMSRMLSGGQHK